MAESTFLWITLAFSKNSRTFALANEPKGVWANSRVAKWGRL